MIKHPHRPSRSSPVLENEPARTETYLVTDERATDRVEGEPPDEAFLAESLYTTSVRVPDEELAEDEDGRGIQIIDLAEEDEEEEEDEEDLDADWKRAEVTGEETPGGTVTLPDQDVVDQIGQAVGVVYNDDEPLDFTEKIGKRDRERWELDPASVDPDARELSEEGDETKPQRKAATDRARS